MQKSTWFFASAFLAASLIVSPVLVEERALASDYGEETPAPAPPAKTTGGSGKMTDPKMMTERHNMMADSLKALRDTMVILKDLKHVPTAEQQKKLDELIKRMDENIVRHEEMMKEMQMKKQ